MVLVVSSGTELDSLASRPSSWAGVVTGLLGLLLVLAGVLKAWSLAHEPWTGSRSSWLSAGEIVFEWMLAAWLISGRRSGLSRFAALVSFGAFAGISTGRWLAHASSCGCFGAVPIPPAATVGVDLLAIMGLLSIGVVGKPRRSVLHDGALSVFLVLTSGLVGTLASKSSYVALPPSESEIAIPTSGIVVLEPKHWIGKQFPLFDYVNIAAPLRSGTWTVLLYHSDCTQCQAAISSLSVHRSQIGAQSGGLAFLEVPPFTKSGEITFPANSLVGQISEAREWFIVTPVMLRVRDGVVVMAIKGDAVLAAANSGLP